MSLSRGSVAERAMRDDIVAFLRAAMPTARIIHELVTGSCRADVAAVEPDYLLIVELKSERDTLARMARQMSEFEACSHAAILCADIRFFEHHRVRSSSRLRTW